MRLTGWRWLAISSLMAMAVSAETRPQYGGTFQVEVRPALVSLDLTDEAQPDSFARRNLTRLVFETLVASDDGGRLHPGLATSWQSLSGNQRWQFRLRKAVKFHDGTSLTPEIAASILRGANPAWKVISEADSVVVECAVPDPNLPEQLALSRNAVVKKGADGAPIGTGPFHIVEWQPGKKVSLAAEENYWGGRPFLDGIEIEMGKSYRDQMIALEMGKADLVEVAPEQLHRISLEGRKVTSSSPIELMALLFSHEAQSLGDKALREALELSVDRASIRSVLLQGAGQPAGGILPTWMGGYGFVFPTEADLPLARHKKEQVKNSPVWTVGYDASDAIARLIVDRTALNAKDSGLVLQPTTSSAADLRLVRIPLAGANPWTSLASVAAVAGLPEAKEGEGRVEDLYDAEKAILSTHQLIPLFHLPVVYGIAPTVKNWSPRLDGGWNLSDVWLGTAKP
jgi:peptide/nickel transport system substrate-binding protein